MRCKKIRRLLSAYLDKELNDKKLSLVEAHLKICGGCQEELRALISAKNLIAGQEKKKAPLDFSESVLKRIRKERFLILDRETIAKKLIPIPLALSLISGGWLWLLSKEKNPTLEEYLTSVLLENKELSLGEEAIFYEEIF